MVVRQRRRRALAGSSLLLLLPCARAECLIEPNALGHVVIPAGMETIPVGAFDGCTGLASVQLPQGLAESWACNGEQGSAQIELY